MHYFVYAKKDTTIYSGSRVDLNNNKSDVQNTGLDSILEISKLTKPNFAENETSRVLIQFDLTDLETNIKNNIFPNFSSDTKYNLRLYEAESKELPTTDTIYAYSLSSSWDMGVGQKFDNPYDTDGATWYNRSTGVTWFKSGSNEGQDYSTTFDGNSMAASQSFVYGTKDIDMDVSKIVFEWVEQAYVDGGYMADGWVSNPHPNNGFIIQRSTTAENDSSNYGNLTFFSRETSTIYVPKLELKWDDSVWSTGSLSALTDEDIVVNIRNLQTQYQEKSKEKIRVVGREKYPAKTYSKTHEGLIVKYLPSGSCYYSVKDAQTDEEIIAFDDYTKLSCDSNGNYFNFWFNGLQPERFYRFCFKVVQNANTSTENIRYFDNDDTFKIVR